MASIRTRKDNGCLFLDFYYQGLRCREQTTLTDIPSNRKRLEKVLAKIEEEISLGKFDYAKYFPNSRAVSKLREVGSASTNEPVSVSPDRVVASSMPPTPLFSDFAEVWYQEKEVEWRRSHKATIRNELDRSLIPEFGDREVGQISKADVLAFRAKLGKVTARGKQTQLSTARINKIMNPLRQILNEAADRFDFRTPFDHIKQLKVKRTDVEPFSLDEVQLILNSVRADFRKYYTVRFFTGLRTGEVDGLKWKFVDFDKRLIMIRETIVNGEEEYTKTDGSQRDIQMSQLVYDALKLQEKATRSLSDFVFCNRQGTPLDHKNVTNRVFYPLLRNLKIKKRRPYQCRHTAATLWLASGESPQWIAMQLGHTTTEMLFRVYSRFVPNLTRKDGSAFERMMAQNVTVPAVQFVSVTLSTPAGTAPGQENREFSHE